MSMLGPIIKTFLKAEIDQRIQKYLTLLTGELDEKNLTLDLHVKLSEVEIKFIGTGMLGNKEEVLKTEHIKNYSFHENTKQGNPRSFLNRPDKVELEVNLTGRNFISGIHFKKEFMGMGVDLQSVSFRFEVSGLVEY